MALTETSLNSSGSSAIDDSLRAPVFVYLTAALKWLVFASIFGYIASWKSHNQEFLNGCVFLTVGRVQAVATAALIYGFGCNMAFMVGLWLMARLSGAPVSKNFYLIIAGIFWNVALTVGIVGIFMGDLRAFELLELPAYVGFPLILASLLISVWVILCVKDRSNPELYASQWFLIAAFLAFPWIQIVAHVMLTVKPAPGVIQALVASWFASNLLWLWFGAIATAVLYYVIPKVLGSTVKAYSLAKYGFIILVFVGTWTGAASLAGGPLPVWIPTVGIAASLVFLIFFVIAGINFLGTLCEGRSLIFDNPILLFAGFASLALVLAGFLLAFTSLRSVAEITQFTIFLDAHHFLIFYGVFSMSAFAFVYWALPKLLGREWPMDFLVSAHFWLAVIGIALTVIPMAIGGWKQGSAMLDGTIPVSEIVRTTSYFMLPRSMAWIFLTLGHGALILNVISIYRPDCESHLEELIRSDAEAGGGLN
ncbi:MAG: cbb3-type cytochrome c oxidase subunit I [Verrucomicrobiae bacterium]|nr:cbb3-type cytochrome c oxidase subunit I [Verrucomicrobiae bacterium]